MQSSLAKQCMLLLLVLGQMFIGVATAWASDPEPAAEAQDKAAAVPAPQAEPTPVNAATSVTPAEDAAKDNSIEAEENSERSVSGPIHRHWDARLGLGAMPFFGRKEPGLAAQWLRHGRSWLKLGLFARTLAQSVRRNESGIVSRRNFSVLGFVGEFDLFGNDSVHPQLTLGVQFGQGWLSRRWQEGETKNFKQTEFYIAEPYLLAHVFHWRRIDWGFGVAYAAVRPKTKSAANSDANSDAKGLSGWSVLLSFQHQI